MSGELAACWVIGAIYKLSVVGFSQCVTVRLVSDDDNGIWVDDNRGRLRFYPWPAIIYAEESDDAS